MCRSYCTTDNDCPLGQVCNTATQQCVDGCGLPGKVMTGDEYLRCPLGQTCQPSGCNASTKVCSKYTCNVRCNLADPLNPTTLAVFTCHNSADHPYTCWGRTGGQFCAEPCSLTARPPTCLAANAACVMVFDGAAGDPPAPICSVGGSVLACTSDINCANKHVGTMTSSVNCKCQTTDLPDAPAGTCRYPTATEGAMICSSVSES